MKRHGMNLIGREGNYSDTVVAVQPVMQIAEVLNGLAQRDVVVSKGMGKDSNRFLRIGNMGIVDNVKVAKFLNAFSQVCGIDDEVTPEQLPMSTSIDSKTFDVDF